MSTQDRSSVLACTSLDRYLARNYTNSTVPADIVPELELEQTDRLFWLSLPGEDFVRVLPADALPPMMVAEQS